jgi:hypothetical protein
MLAGRWHNNQDGATKQFTPDRKTFLQGDLFGFWPEGARYNVSAVNPEKRSLHLQADTKEPSEENEYHHFTAEVAFTQDGQHMTMKRHMPNHLPDETVTYYRAP